MRDVDDNVDDVEDMTDDVEGIVGDEGGIELDDDVELVLDVAAAVVVENVCEDRVDTEEAAEERVDTDRECCHRQSRYRRTSKSRRKAG